MSKTKLKKITIEKFRALNNVDVEFGDCLTVICGKNGTSKSSILGTAAQIFSFEKDYSTGASIPHRDIAGRHFKSQFSDHFRISDAFDVPGSMSVSIELHDGYTDTAATARLELMKRGKASRPVVRNNSTAKGNTSRNFTHPVIFLSLKRLYPIADRDYKVIDFTYLADNKKTFIGLTNELLNQSSSMATGTEGTISSAVAHGSDYDQDSVSAGEDNAGQIVLALLSFKKLKEEYGKNYKGGLLLIDEADAGLFPTAQINLIKILERECRDLQLQVIMTSHSPGLIEHAYELSQKYPRKFRTVYLSNTFGSVQVMQDWSWPQILGDISTKTVVADPTISLPNVHVYFEDGEGAGFFRALVNRQPLKKFIDPLTDITLGCSNYLELIKKRIPEFSQKSIVCLDADVKDSIEGKDYPTVVLLPGHLPPDQLLFEFLYNLPANDSFWINSIQFTKAVFTRSASEVIREFGVAGDLVDIAQLIAEYKGKAKPREVFKRFYKDPEIQGVVDSGEKPHNPWRYWIARNPMLCNEFLDRLKGSLLRVMRDGYAVDQAKLSLIEVRHKKV